MFVQVVKVPLAVMNVCVETGVAVPVTLMRADPSSAGKVPLVASFAIVTAPLRMAFEATASVASLPVVTAPLPSFPVVTEASRIALVVTESAACLPVVTVPLTRLLPLSAPTNVVAVITPPVLPSSKIVVP